MPFFKAKEQVPAPAVDFDHLPRHIAIIMDGNGRWAQKRGLPRTAGHAAGAENFRTIATYCKDIGLEYLTVYAFSTENWKRPAEEVGAIMGLLKKYLLEAISRMERDRVKMEFFGDLSPAAPGAPGPVPAHPGDLQGVRRLSGKRVPQLRGTGTSCSGRPGPTPRTAWRGRPIPTT